MIKHIFLLCSLLLFVTQGLAHPMGLYEKNILWDKNEIKVCWGLEKDINQTTLLSDSSGMIHPLHLRLFTEEQKQIIQNIIQAEYSDQKTKIHFTGFQNCKERDESDVILIRTHATGVAWGMATLGQNGEEVYFEGSRQYIKSQDKKKAYVMLNTVRSSRFMISPLHFLEMSALHEFGHLAGLRHEHANIKEAINDPNCHKGLGLTGERTQSSTVVHKKYDPNSIMNYCYTNLIAFNTGLNFETSDIASVIHLEDESLFDKSKLENGKDLYRIKIQLSQGDQEALRSIYP